MEVYPLLLSDLAIGGSSGNLGVILGLATVAIIGGTSVLVSRRRKRK